uniref:ERCC4 domain-containing protein n=1 Tax=Callorhinchus milii TaxID=7868 RepID=A0A4W3GCJ2_CALMI
MSSSEGEEGPLAPLSHRLRGRLAGSQACGMSAPPPRPPGGPPPAAAAGRSARGWDISDSESERGPERGTVPPTARERRQRPPAGKENTGATRRALAQSVKALKPNHCLSHMLLSIDPGLLEEDVGGETLSALQATQSSCVVEEQAVGRSVTWRRRRVQPGAGGEHTVGVPPLWDVTVCKLAAVLIHRTQSLHFPVSPAKHFGMSSGREKCYCILNVRIINIVAVSQTKAMTSHFVGFIMKSLTCPIPQALVHLQLTTGVQVQFLETWKEFADHINRFTKAVAETPFKRGREKADISFYMENQGSREVKVDRSGKGLLQVWSRQIQQFNRVSADMANAIVSVYPSPWLLNQAYQECSSERERQRLLAAIPVRRGEGVTSSTRKIGPQLSKRVYLQMTSTDPNLSLEIHDSLHVETSSAHLV